MTTTLLIRGVIKQRCSINDHKNAENCLIMRIDIYEMKNFEDSQLILVLRNTVPMTENRDVVNKRTACQRLDTPSILI